MNDERPIVRGIVETVCDFFEEIIEQLPTAVYIYEIGRPDQPITARATKAEAYIEKVYLAKLNNHRLARYYIREQHYLVWPAHPLDF